MARQKGPFKISGTIGGANFFSDYVRIAGGGFNGHTIRTSPRMVRVRENSSEFGNCSVIKKLFLLAVAPFFIGIKNRPFHSNLMQLFLYIKALDPVSVRGKRHVKEGLQTAKGKHLLKQYDFTLKHSMMGAICSTSSFDWNSQQISISNFNPSHFKTPKTATHVGVTLGILDFGFDSFDSSLEVSPTYFLDIKAGATSFVLAPNQVIAPEHYGMAVLGLRYYEVIENEIYGFDTPIGMRVLDCLNLG